MITKIDDIGVGYCIVCETWVSGHILTGSNDVFTNGLPTAQLHSIVQGGCGHTGSLICATKNRVNSLPIGIIGSQFVGIFNGNIITASTNVRSV